MESGPEVLNCPECAEPNPREVSHCLRCGLELAAEARARHWVGRRLASFRIESLRRTTLTGTAYAAVELERGLAVELKVLPASASAREVAAFRREAAFAILHPRLVRILSHGAHEEVLYIASDARDDERPLRGLAPLPPARAVALAADLAAALGCLHRHGLVFPGLQPAHLLVDGERARLAELGLARPAGNRSKATPPEPLPSGRPPPQRAYAAPETARGPHTPAADLYALGAVLAYGLAGAAPFPPELEGREPWSGEVALPGLEPLLRELTAPDPARRPRDASAVRSRLLALLGVEESRGPRRCSRSCPELLEETARSFQPSDFDRLPRPLARAALGAWNARPGLPRRMVAWLFWEGVTRLFAALGCALLLDAGRPLPADQRPPFRLSFGQWLGIARDALRAAPGADPLAEEARAALFGVGPRGGTLLAFLHTLVSLRNASAHDFPRDEEVDLLSRAAELAREPLFQHGGLMRIEEADLRDGAARYELLELSGVEAYRGRPFLAAPGLRTDRLYWRRGTRFVELDPFWTWAAGEVQLLARCDARGPRYAPLGEKNLRKLAGRAEELAVLDHDELGPFPAPAPASADDPRLGKLIGGSYRIAAALGSHRYRAWDARLGREVVVRMWSAARGSDPAGSAAKLRQLRRFAELGHPRFVRCYEVGAEADVVWAALALLPGSSLAAWLDAPGEETVAGRAAWLCGAARALHAAHRAGLVHGDLHPGHLQVSAEQLWVLELPLHSGPLAAPRYTPPERLVDPALRTPACDVYGLGACLFAALLGAPPFAGLDAEHAVLKAVQRGELRDRALASGLPAALAAVVARATEPDARARYGSAGALAEDLERWLDGRPVRARPSRGRRLWRSLRKLWTDDAT